MLRMWIEILKYPSVGKYTHYNLAPKGIIHNNNLNYSNCQCKNINDKKGLFYFEKLLFT